MLPYAILLPVVLFSAVSEPSPAVGPDTPADSAEDPAEDTAFASRTVTAIDCVLAHHIDPPTRQQLVLQALRVLAREAGEPRPVGLGRRVSELATSEELRGLLAESWKSARARSSHIPAELETLVVAGIVASVPGPGRLVPAREHAVERQFAANRYVGIGIALAMDGQWPRMQQIFEGGPADQAGLRGGDLILEINGIDTAGKPLTEIVDMLRGPAGSDVTVVLQQRDENGRRTCTMTRGEVPFKTVSHQRIDDGQEQPIGYIRVDRIAASTPHELLKLEPALNGVGTIVLDLRRLQGSELHPTVLLADAFLDGGTVGRVRTRADVKAFPATRDCLFRDLPMIVFVNRYTSGTAEWLSAALQDGRQATLAGEPTAGQAYVAQSVPLPERDDVLVLATGILERADGRPLIRPLDEPVSTGFEPERVALAGRHDAWRIQPQVHIPELIPPGSSDERLIARAVEAVRSKLRETPLQTND